MASLQPSNLCDLQRLQGCFVALEPVAKANCLELIILEKIMLSNMDSWSKLNHATRAILVTTEKKESSDPRKHEENWSRGWIFQTLKPYSQYFRTHKGALGDFYKSHSWRCVTVTHQPSSRPYPTILAPSSSRTGSEACCLSKANERSKEIIEQQPPPLNFQAWESRSSTKLLKIKLPNGCRWFWAHDQWPTRYLLYTPASYQSWRPNFVSMCPW